VADFSEQREEAVGSIKNEEFIDQLKD